MGVVKQKCSNCGAELDLFAEKPVRYCPYCSAELNTQNQSESGHFMDKTDSNQSNQWFLEKRRVGTYVPGGVIIICAIEIINLALIIAKGISTGSFFVDPAAFVRFQLFLLFFICYLVILPMWTNGDISFLKKSITKVDETVNITWFGGLKIIAPEEFGFTNENTERNKNRLYAKGKVALDIERIYFEELKSAEIVNKLKTGVFFREQYKDWTLGKYKTYEYKYGNPDPYTFCIQSYYCTEDAYFKFTVQCPIQKAAMFSNMMVKMISQTEIKEEVTCPNCCTKLILNSGKKISYCPYCAENLSEDKEILLKPSIQKKQRAGRQ